MNVTDGGKWSVCPTQAAHTAELGAGPGHQTAERIPKVRCRESQKSSSLDQVALFQVSPLGCACWKQEMQALVGSSANRPIYPKPPSKCCSQMPVLFQQNSDKTFPHTLGRKEHVPEGELAEVRGKY